MAIEVAATRRRFTRKEYYRMAEVGILGRRDRVELIKGEIVEMSPIGPRHGAFVDNLTRLLVRRLPDDVIVRVQGPLALSDDTEPEPDLTVLRRRAVPYKDREPWAEDALLVIEVLRARWPMTARPSCGSTPRPASRSTGWWTASPRPSRCTVAPARRAIATSAWWLARRRWRRRPSPTSS
jgi:hypothetical protein